LSTTTTEGARTDAPGDPGRLSPSGWVAAFKGAAKHFIEDDCSGLAHQIAFGALLAFLPTVILLIGLFGLLGPGVFDSIEHFVASVAPHEVVNIIDVAKKDAAHNKSGSAVALAVGIIAAVWTASGAMGAVVKAVNRAYGIPETRPFWKIRLISLLLVLATGIVLVGTFLLMVFGGNLGEAIARRTSLGDNFKLFWDIARWPIAFTAVLLFFALVYDLAPNLEERRWRWVTPGSLVGSLMWVTLSALFALYTSYSSSYDRTYGSLAGAIVLLLWLNYSAWAILFGAELNAELDRQSAGRRPA
jgi:membrane protein